MKFFFKKYGTDTFIITEYTCENFSFLELEPRARGSDIKLPPGAEITYCDSGSSSSWLRSIYHRLEEILKKKNMVAEEIL